MQQFIYKFLQFGTFVLFSNFAFSQKISGYVFDAESKEPLVGASVYWKASQIGATTTPEGKFSVWASDTKTLVVSYIGYETKELSIGLFTQNLTIYLTKTSYQADEVVVNANRASQQSAMAFNTISKEAINKQNNGQDIPLILNQSTSLVSTSDAGAGIGYTGIRIRGTDATRINVTVNGIPLNDAESQGVYWVNMPDFASSVSSIQIQRGVGTSANGAGAFGASINIQSNDFNKEPYIELNNSYGSFNSWKYTLKFGSGLLGKNFTFDGRLSKIKSDGFVDRGFSNLRSYYYTFAYFGKKSFVRFVNFAGKEKTYQAWNGISEEKLQTDRRYNAFTYPNQTDNYFQNHFQLLSSHILAKNLNLNVNLHYTKGKGYYEEEKLEDKLSNYGLKLDSLKRADLIRQKWLDNDFYGFTYSLDYQLNKKISTSLGGAANTYDGDHFGDVISIAQRPNQADHRWYQSNSIKKDFNIYSKTTAYFGSKSNIYLDLQWRSLSLKMKGTASKMQDISQAHSYSFFNPKVGINHSISEQVSAYASLAVGQKEPNRTDFIDNKGAELPKPEQLQDLEAGLRLFHKKGNLLLNGYFMNYKNQLALTGAINEVGESIRTNIPKSHRLGIELESNIAINKALTWAFNSTISANKVAYIDELIPDYEGFVQKIAQKSTDLAYSPNVILANTFSQKIGNSLELSLLSKYVGKQYLDNTSNENRKLDAYFTNDIRLLFHKVSKKKAALTAGIYLNNVLNERYESNGYTFSYLYDKQVYTENYYYPQAGRNFMLSLNLKL